MVLSKRLLVIEQGGLQLDGTNTNGHQSLINRAYWIVEETDPNYAVLFTDRTLFKRMGSMSKLQSRGSMDTKEEQGIQR